MWNISNILGSMIANGARCSQEIKSRIVMAQAAFNKNKALLTSKLDLNLRKKIVKCYIWIIALCGAETWTLWTVDQKYKESSEMWCWRRLEKISWTDRVRNNEVLHRVKKRKQNPTYNTTKRKANWLGHILRRNCLLKHVTEGKIGVGKDDEKDIGRYWITLTFRHHASYI